MLDSGRASRKHGPPRRYRPAGAPRPGVRRRDRTLSPRTAYRPDRRGPEVLRARAPAIRHRLRSRPRAATAAAARCASSAASPLACSTRSGTPSSSKPATRPRSVAAGGEQGERGRSSDRRPRAPARGRPRPLRAGRDARGRRRARPRRPDPRAPRPRCRPPRRRPPSRRRESRARRAGSRPPRSIARRTLRAITSRLAARRSPRQTSGASTAGSGRSSRPSRAHNRATVPAACRLAEEAPRPVLVMQDERRLDPSRAACASPARRVPDRSRGARRRPESRCRPRRPWTTAWSPTAIRDGDRPYPRRDRGRTAPSRLPASSRRRARPPPIRGRPPARPPCQRATSSSRPSAPARARSASATARRKASRRENARIVRRRRQRAPDDVEQPVPLSGGAADRRSPSPGGGGGRPLVEPEVGTGPVEKRIGARHRSSGSGRRSRGGRTTIAARCPATARPHDGPLEPPPGRARGAPRCGVGRTDAPRPPRQARPRRPPATRGK